MGNKSGRERSSSVATSSPTPVTEPKEDPILAKYKNVNKKIGVGIIGIGARMLDLLFQLYPYEKIINLVGISDEAPQAYEAAMQERLFENKKVEFFPDYNDLLKKEEVEWVLIGSRNCLHKEHCVAAFKAGKHVFCEKPLAITIDECDEIRKVHKASGQLFVTGFVLRYSDFYKKIKELVSNGEVGKLVSIEANELLKPPHGSYIMRNWRRFREQSGPHLLEKCCHDIDLLNWIVDSLPARVASFGGLNVFIPENKPKDEKAIDYYNSWSHAWEKVDAFESEKNIEDNQVAILEYRNNVRVSFHTNSNSGISERKMTICGLTGTIRADLITGKIAIQRFVPYGKPLEMIDTGSRGMHGGADGELIAELVESMVNGTKPITSGEEGFISAITCLAIDRARIEKQVVDVNPYWKQFEVGEEKSEEKKIPSSEMKQEQ